MFVFVSDVFSRDYKGGAELTSEALIEHSQVPIIQLYSSQINQDIINKLKDRHWIFGNYHHMGTGEILMCCKSLEYSILEYDYNVSDDICLFLLKNRNRDLDSLLEKIHYIGEYSLSLNKKITNKNVKSILD